MTKTIVFIFAFSFLVLQGVNAEENISIKLTGVPDRLILPLAKGTNRILTAIIKGGTAKSVWLAPNRESTGRIMLTQVDDNEYQINLADPMVSAILLASEVKQFYVFVETTDQQVIASILVQYSTYLPKPTPPTAITLYIKQGSGREKLHPWYEHSWHNPAQVEAFEIEFNPIDAEISATADVDGKLWRFTKDEEKEDTGLLRLEMTAEIRKAWQHFGSLSISWNTRSTPIIIHAIPGILTFDEIPESMIIIQRHSEYLPGSNEYLIASLGDITAGQVLLSITTRHRKKLIMQRSVKQGDRIDFEYGGKEYRLALLSLINVLIGDDYAVFLFSPKTITEVQKIEFLLKALSHANVRLLRNGKEYSGTAAGSHLRQEFQVTENHFETMEDFLSEIASHSRETGREYLVKEWDGSTSEVISWFRDIASVFIVE